MKKTLLYSAIALALVLGLTLPMATLVMGSEIAGTKGRSPDASPYDAGEIIHYVMTITNPGNNTAINTLTSIWDTLPDGSTHWFIQEGVDSPLVQNPGDTATFDLGYWIVGNTFEAEGYDSGEDDVYVLVTSNTQVNQPPVGGEAFPIDKLYILAPWVALGAAIVAGAAIFVRRRHARS